VCRGGMRALHLVEQWVELVEEGRWSSNVWCQGGVGELDSSGMAAGWNLLWLAGAADGENRG